MITTAAVAVAAVVAVAAIWDLRVAQNVSQKREPNEFSVMFTIFLLG